MSDIGRSVVLLAGGRSTRLGRDKPFVEIGGRTVLERLLDATREIGDVVLSVREPERFAEALVGWGWAPGERFHRDGRTVRIVVDPTPDLGPVAGLASGLAAVDADHAVVLAGDLPFVSAELVGRLDASLAKAPAADAAVPRVADRPQPLCAAYRSGVADRAAAWVARPAAPGPSMADLLAELEIRWLGDADLGGLGDLTVLTRGIDAPDDVEWASRASVSREP